MGQITGQIGRGMYSLSKILALRNEFKEEFKKVNKLLFKLKNIDTMVENIDEELISDDISNDYNNFKSYCNDFLQGNSDYIIKYVDYQ